MSRVFFAGSLIASFLAGAAVLADSVEPATEREQELEATIEFLLHGVAYSDVIFIRNGREYKPAKAAEHMQRKYKHFRKEIHAAEDFIRLTGTRSLVSGKSYTVRFPDGQVRRAADWLMDLVHDYRHADVTELTSGTQGT